MSNLHYFEVGQLDSASSALHWNALVRLFKRVRSGALPADWDAHPYVLGLRAKAFTRWGAQAEGAINTTIAQTETP